MTFQIEREALVRRERDRSCNVGYVFQHCDRIAVQRCRKRVRKRRVVGDRAVMCDARACRRPTRRQGDVRDGRVRERDDIRAVGPAAEDAVRLGGCCRFGDRNAVRNTLCRGFGCAAVCVEGYVVTELYHEGSRRAFDRHIAVRREVGMRAFRRVILRIEAYERAAGDGERSFLTL